MLERRLVCLNRRRTKIFGQNFVSNCNRRITFWQIQHKTHFLPFASFNPIHISIMSCSSLHRRFHVHLSDGTLRWILILYAFSPFFPLKIKIDAKTYFDNDIAVSKSINLDKLAKAGTVVDKTE